MIGHANCRPPSAFTTSAGTVWTCECGKVWRCTWGKLYADRGWARVR